MSAATDYPYLSGFDMLGLWLTMCDEIDSLRAEVDRLETDFGEHLQRYTCRPDRQEP